MTVFHVSLAASVSLCSLHSLNCLNECLKLDYDIDTDESSSSNATNDVAGTIGGAQGGARTSEVNPSAMVAEDKPRKPRVPHRSTSHGNPRKLANTRTAQEAREALLS